MYKLVSVLALSVLIHEPSFAIAQQTPASTPQQGAPVSSEPQMPPLPSMEGQQGEVVSKTAVSPPKKKHDDAARLALATAPKTTHSKEPHAKNAHVQKTGGKKAARASKSNKIRRPKK